MRINATDVLEQKRYGLDYGTFFKEKKRGNAPINFDADSKKQAKNIARHLLKLNKKYPLYKIFWRKSSSRRGFHFTIFFHLKQLYIPNKNVLKIRKKYGDCYGRLKADMIRARSGMGISILFNHKKSFRSGRGRQGIATQWRELKFLKQIN